MKDKIRKVSPLRDIHEGRGYATLAAIYSRGKEHVLVVEYKLQRTPNKLVGIICTFFVLFLTGFMLVHSPDQELKQLGRLMIPLAIVGGLIAVAYGLHVIWRLSSYLKLFERSAINFSELFLEECPEKTGDTATLHRLVREVLLKRAEVILRNTSDKGQNEWEFRKAVDTLVDLRLEHKYRVSQLYTEIFVEAAQNIGLKVA